MTKLIFEYLTLLIISHLVGDYVLQIDFIAKTKGTNDYHLLVHCALYCLPFYIKEKSKLTESEWVEYTKQIWDIAIPNKSDLAFGIHSAIMPEEIVRRCVKMFSFYNGVVLDPFTGSGTTLKVAKELGRQYVGYELYKSYEDIINKKLDSVGDADD